jgi:hypothetical protein
MGLPIRFTLAVALMAAATSACENNPAKDAPVTAKNQPQLVQSPYPGIRRAAAAAGRHPEKTSKDGHAAPD